MRCSPHSTCFSSNAPLNWFSAFIISICAERAIGNPSWHALLCLSSWDVPFYAYQPEMMYPFMLNHPRCPLVCLSECAKALKLSLLGTASLIRCGLFGWSFCSRQNGRCPLLGLSVFTGVPTAPPFFTKCVCVNGVIGEWSFDQQLKPWIHTCETMTLWACSPAPTKLKNRV